MTETSDTPRQPHRIHDSDFPCAECERELAAARADVAGLQEYIDGLPEERDAHIAELERTAKLPQWEHPLVQNIYDLLCNKDDEYPRNSAEHWEGWISRRIVQMLSDWQRGIEADRDRLAAEVEKYHVLRRALLRNVIDADLLHAKTDAELDEAIAALSAPDEGKVQ